MAEHFDLLNNPVTVTVTAGMLMDVLGDHQPIVRITDDVEFFACSCGWDEDDEVVTVDGRTLAAIASVAVASGEFSLGSKMLPPADETVDVPSPNPIVSHIISVLVRGSVTDTATVIGRGQVQ